MIQEVSFDHLLGHRANLVQLVRAYKRKCTRSLRVAEPIWCCGLHEGLGHFRRFTKFTGPTSQQESIERGGDIRHLERVGGIVDSIRTTDFGSPEATPAMIRALRDIFENIIVI
jgi:hypothetical protein